MTGASFFANKEAQRGFATIDALRSVTRALDLVDGVESDETFELLRRAASAQADQAVDIWSAATNAGIDLSLAACAMILRAHIEQWNDGGSLAIVTKGPALPIELRLHGGWPLSQAWDALVGLALTSVGLDDEGSEAPAICSSLTELAIGAEATNELEVAVACAMSASNFALATDVTSLQAIDVAMRLGIESRAEDAIYGLLLRRAQLLAALSIEDRHWLLATFEAMEAVLWHLPEDPDRRKMTLAFADQIIRGLPELAGLLPLGVIAAADAPTDLPAGIPAPAWLFARRVWEVDPEEIRTTADLVSDLAIGQEDARLELVLRDDRQLVETSWRSWSFDHPSLSRAMPQFSSVLRERDLDELILSLAHETTHVISMLGGLAFAVLGLRAALLETELRLWMVLTNNRPVDLQRVSAVGVAPLVDATVVGLGQAEQALELTWKLRTLTGVWAPWLEGIAVFAETSADPSLDPDVSSYVASVLAHLVDVDLEASARKQGGSLGDAFLSALHDGETLWSTAIQRNGQQRLRLQLATFHQRYLPGYLVVRSIVSAWRERRPGLSGPAAFRLLLHLTRFGTFDAIPDLGERRDVFGNGARAGFLHWLEWVRDIDAETLETFFENARTPVGWLDGRLNFDPGPKVDERLERSVREAVRTLTRPIDIGRVPDAPADTREVLRIVQEALASTEPIAIESGFAKGLSTSLNALPISQQDCQFWLNRTQGRLLTLVRTTSLDRDRGRHLHIVTSTRLSEHEFAELEREIQRRKAPRMRVARVADLALVRPDTDTTWFGRQYLAYSYGSWIHVSPAGMAIGSEEPSAPSVVDDIRQRLADDSLLAFENRTVGDGTEGATRTLAWINSTTSGWSDLDLPLEPWLAHVTQLAKTLAETTSREIGQDLDSELILFALGADGGGERLVTDGLRIIRDIDPAWLTEVLRALDESGRAPSHDEWLDANADRLNASAAPLFNRGRSGWDVTIAGGR